MKTVSKFISIDIIFVQTALNWANTCVFSMYSEDTFKPILATSRVILKLILLGYWSEGQFWPENQWFLASHKIPKSLMYMQSIVFFFCFEPSLYETFPYMQTKQLTSLADEWLTNVWTDLRIQTNSCQLILQLQFSCGCKSRLDMNSQSLFQLMPKKA